MTSLAEPAPVDSELEEEDEEDEEEEDEEDVLEVLPDWEPLFEALGDDLRDSGGSLSSPALKLTVWSEVQSPGWKVAKRGVYNFDCLQGNLSTLLQCFH